MSEQQNAYLKAMGIDVWFERRSSIPVEEVQTIEIVQPTPEQIVTDSLPEQSPEIEARVNTDSLDWQGLQSVVAECHSCELSKNRTKMLFGAGNQAASLMVIGDAPGTEDEQRGEPISGEAGKLFTAMLKAMGYQRNDVYITNLVKCPTLNNKNPAG